MRPSRTLIMCGAALLAAAGLSIGQEQGPVRDPSTTVAKPKKADADKNAGESDLPPIPSRLKKDKVDVGNLPSFKSNVDIVTVDVAVVDNKGHFIPGIPPGNFRVLEDNVPQQVRGVNHGRSAHDRGHGDRVQQPVPAVLGTGLVSDAAAGVGFCLDPEAGGLRGRGGL